MNKTEIIKYFKDDIDSLMVLFESRNFESRNYLESRRMYKLDTFANMAYSESLPSIYQDFNRLINRLSEEDLEDFIRITCVQDIMVFDQIMIDSLNESDDNTSITFTNFIVKHENMYENMFTELVTDLPTSVNEYLLGSRLKFKTSLYLRSHSSCDEIHTNNRKEIGIISDTDDDTKKKFARTMMLQDLILICEYHKQNFTNSTQQY